MRERGLKLGLVVAANKLAFVAPRAGAWIEAGNTTGWRAKLRKSLPVRERGLKPLEQSVYTSCA